MDDLATTGLFNFRAVKPYKTARGRLRENTLYRAGAFDALTEVGKARMRELGVVRVFDVRNRMEKGGRPVPFEPDDGITLFAPDHGITTGDLYPVACSVDGTQADVAREMAVSYSNVPLLFRGIFGDYLRHGVDEGFPMVIHCTAGKDRTGIAIAMLLNWLGVSREDMIEDYLASNAGAEELRRRLAGRDTHAGKLREDLLGPIVICDPVYLDAMFTALERDFGDVDTYFREGLGLSENDLTILRDRLEHV